VAELASAVNVSQTHLTNLFQVYLGMSPAKYITRIRIEECKQLLSCGELSVGEIAEMMGYSGIPHVCKQFRRWTGVSPAGFARQRKNSNTHKS
jgi:transcriptional regulator GlxA family with amidase domain